MDDMRNWLVCERIVYISNNVKRNVGIYIYIHTYIHSACNGGLCKKSLEV